ncbi:hypothetical protein ABQE93_23845 [Mycolicibacterium sp. XJ662]
MVSPYLPPPIESATDPVHSAADMRRRWQALLGPLGFGQRLLWIGFVGADRRMYQTMSQLPLGSRPTRRLVGDVMSRLRFMVDNIEERTTVAFLLTRPGGGPISDLDRQWACLLTDAANEHGVPIEPIFRANDESLVQVDPQTPS